MPDTIGIAHKGEWFITPETRDRLTPQMVHLLDKLNEAPKSH